MSLSVAAQAVGSYTVNVDAQALTTAPAGGNTSAASASLNVTAPVAGSGGGGGLDWLDMLFSALLVWARFRVRARA